ncbi:MAG: DsbA family protein [Pseudomonadota bacterium]
MKEITVYVDFKSPAAYLAIQPTLSLARRTQTQLVWQPLQTKQTSIPKQLPNEDRGATHRRVRAIARRDTHLLYARHQKLAMNFPDTYAETDLALAAMESITSDRTTFVEAAFRSYWIEGADLNDPATVKDVLNSCGQTSVPEPSDVQHIVQHIQARAVEDGVIDAPGYVVGDQVFVGREHLPWIEEILT